MSAQIRMSSILAALAVVCLAGQAIAQDKPIRVRGDVIAIDGPMMTVKSRDGKEMKIKLADKCGLSVFLLPHIVPISRSRTSNRIPISAFPRYAAARRQPARHACSTSSRKPLRGVAEGFGPWDVQPGSTMTNATVVETVAGVDGQTIMVKYKDGEKKIIVPKDAVLVTYVPGDKAELVAGAKIFVIAAVPQPDGSFTSARVNVGRGVAPPM